MDKLFLGSIVYDKTYARSTILYIKKQLDENKALCVSEANWEESIHDLKNLKSAYVDERNANQIFISEAHFLRNQKIMLEDIKRPELLTECDDTRKYVVSETEESIYQKLKAIGAEMDSHESDLYIKATPETEALTKGQPNRSFFISQRDKQRWIELPFAFEPWWEKRVGKKNVNKDVNITNKLANPEIEEGQPSWIDKHSVNCFKCGKLVDERDCVPNPDESKGGEICPECQKKMDLGEGDKKWMQKAFSKNKGGLHKALDVPQGETIPKSKMKKAAQSDSGHTRKMAQAAINANPDKFGSEMDEAEKNPMGKMRDKENPYEIWQGDGEFEGWEWRVLKKWQAPSKEAGNSYARWFCAVKSPMTHGGWDMGDTYVKDVVNYAHRVDDANKESVVVKDKSGEIFGRYSNQEEAVVAIKKAGLNIDDMSIEGGGLSEELDQPTHADRYYTPFVIASFSDDYLLATFRSLQMKTDELNPQESEYFENLWKEVQKRGLTSQKQMNEKKCPKCGEEVWDKATVDQRLNKCWKCGTRFDEGQTMECPNCADPISKKDGKYYCPDCKKYWNNDKVKWEWSKETHDKTMQDFGKVDVWDEPKKKNEETTGFTYGVNKRLKIKKEGEDRVLRKTPQGTEFMGDPLPTSRVHRKTSQGTEFMGDPLPHNIPFKVVPNPYTKRMTAIQVPEKYAEQAATMINNAIGSYFGSRHYPKGYETFYPVVNKDTEDLSNLFTVKEYVEQTPAPQMAGEKGGLVEDFKKLAGLNKSIDQLLREASNCIQEDLQISQYIDSMYNNVLSKRISEDGKIKKSDIDRTVEYISKLFGDNPKEVRTQLESLLYRDKVLIVAELGNPEQNDDQLPPIEDKINEGLNPEVDVEFEAENDEGENKRYKAKVELDIDVDDPHDPVYAIQDYSVIGVEDENGIAVNVTGAMEKAIESELAKIDVDKYTADIPEPDYADEPPDYQVEPDDVPLETEKVNQNSSEFASSDELPAPSELAHKKVTSYDEISKISNEWETVLRKNPKFQEFANTLMDIDNEVWDRLGIESGSQLSSDPKLQKRYATTIKKTLADKGITEVYAGVYFELEDQNYHTFNQFLLDNGYYYDYDVKQLEEGEEKPSPEELASRIMKTPKDQMASLGAAALIGIMAFKLGEKFIKSVGPKIPELKVEAIDFAMPTPQKEKLGEEEAVGSDTSKKHKLSDGSVAVFNSQKNHWEYYVWEPIIKKYILSGSTKELDMQPKKPAGAFVAEQTMTTPEILPGIIYKQKGFVIEKTPEGFDVLNPEGEVVKSADTEEHAFELLMMALRDAGLFEQRDNDDDGDNIDKPSGLGWVLEEIKAGNRMFTVTVDVDLEWVDDSFSHEFGTEHRGHWEVTDWSYTNIEEYQPETGDTVKQWIWKELEADLTAKGQLEEWKQSIEQAIRDRQESLEESRKLKTVESIYEDFNKLSGIKEDDIPIAYNTSEWHWEYDNYEKEAVILKDVQGNLSLKITETKRKTGLGAGEWTADIVNISVGTLDAPELGKIQTTLARNSIQRSRAGWPFKKIWTDAITKEKGLLRDIVNKHKGVEKTYPSAKEEPAEPIPAGGGFSGLGEAVQTQDLGTWTKEHESELQGEYEQYCKDQEAEGAGKVSYDAWAEAYYNMLKKHDSLEEKKLNEDEEQEQEHEYDIDVGNKHFSVETSVILFGSDGDSSVGDPGGIGVQDVQVKKVIDDNNKEYTEEEFKKILTPEELKIFETELWKTAEKYAEWEEGPGPEDRDWDAENDLRRDDLELYRDIDEAKKCPKCGKPQKENTEGDMKYCQGHSPFDEPVKKSLDEANAPKIMEIPQEVIDDQEAGDDLAVADYISDQTGWLVSSLNVVKKGGKWIANNIVYDMTEAETQTQTMQKPTRSPWGKPDDVREIASGVYWVSTPGHGGLMVAMPVAKDLLSPAARKEGRKYFGYYTYEEDEQYAPAAYELLKQGIGKTFFAGTSPENLIKVMSSYRPDYLQAVGIEPDKEAYARYQKSAEDDKMRKEKNPDLIVSASMVDGQPEQTKVYTADNHMYIVTGYDMHNPRLSATKIVQDLGVDKQTPRWIVAMTTPRGARYRLSTSGETEKDAIASALRFRKGSTIHSVTPSVNEMSEGDDEGEEKETMKCRYCGHPSEDDSGVCAKCYKRYEGNESIDNKTKQEIMAVVNNCMKNGMKDSNSIYQQVLDTVPNALSDRETEELVDNLVMGNSLQKFHKSIKEVIQPQVQQPQFNVNDKVNINGVPQQDQMAGFNGQAGTISKVEPDGITVRAGGKEAKFMQPSYLQKVTAPTTVTETDRPEYGKIYALTGKSGEKAISQGHSWKDSEVKHWKCACGHTADGNAVYDEKICPKCGKSMSIAEDKGKRFSNQAMLKQLKQQPAFKGAEVVKLSDLKKFTDFKKRGKL